MTEPGYFIKPVEEPVVEVKAAEGNLGSFVGTMRITEPNGEYRDVEFVAPISSATIGVK